MAWLPPFGVPSFIVRSLSNESAKSSKLELSSSYKTIACCVSLPVYQCDVMLNLIAHFDRIIMVC